MQYLCKRHVELAPSFRTPEEGPDISPILDRPALPAVTEASYVGLYRDFSWRGIEDEKTVGFPREHQVYVVVPHKGKSTYVRALRDWYNQPRTAFCWGYYGSGPSALAYSILVNALHARPGRGTQMRDNRAWALHEDFKCEIIAPLNMDRDFILPARLVHRWLEAHPWRAGRHE